MDQRASYGSVSSAIKNVRILGAGSYLPIISLSNEELSHCCPIDPGWVEEKLGIRERHVVKEDEKTSDLATRAALVAVEQCGISLDSIDLLVVATATPDKQAPSTACIVSHKLGLTRVAAFDVSAVCCGFMYALTITAQFLETGASRRALVIGADAFSRVTDWSSPDCVYFGDGAGAVLVERAASQHERLVFSLTADTSGLDCFAIPSSDHKFRMDAGGVYKFARRLIRESAEEVLSRAGVSSNQIASVVPHQASIKLLRDVASDIGIGIDKFHLNMDRVANTAGATVPIALSEAWANGAFKADDWTLFLAAGAGMTAGAALYQWS